MYHIKPNNATTETAKGGNKENTKIATTRTTQIRIVIRNDLIMLEVSQIFDEIFHTVGHQVFQHTAWLSCFGSF